MILIAALVAQKHGRTVILRDQQIGGAVAVVVSGNNRARIFELNLVEANLGSDVFESIGTKIAEQPHFAFAIFRLANRDQINPAIVVVVQGRDAVGDAMKSVFGSWIELNLFRDRYAIARQPPPAENE